MLKINKRQSDIYKLIREREAMPVRDIVPLFHVTAPTIRKDLTHLEKLGLVVRTHGEVHMPTESPIDIPLQARTGLYREAKISIAYEAVKHIKNGDSIVLDAGSTTLEIAKLLVNFDKLTVITNSLPIAMALSESSVTVCMLGGLLFGHELTLMGPETEDGLGRIEANKTFISPDGIRSNYGFVATQPIDAGTKKAMVKAGNTVYAVLDSTKLEQTSVYPFAAFGDVDYLITEKDVTNQNLKSAMLAEGIEIIVSNPQK